MSTFVYDLPPLARRNRLIRGVAGAWQLSGIIRLQTGPYYTVTASVPPFGTRRGDYPGGPVLAPDGKRGPNNWIDKTAFGPPPVDRYGNSGSGIVEGPGLQSYDLSVKRFFQVNERIALRFQADVFNAINIANLNTCQPVRRKLRGDLDGLPGAHSSVRHEAAVLIAAWPLRVCQGITVPPLRARLLTRAVRLRIPARRGRLER